MNNASHSNGSMGLLIKSVEAIRPSSISIDTSSFNKSSNGSYIPIPSAAPPSGSGSGSSFATSSYSSVIKGTINNNNNNNINKSTRSSVIQTLYEIDFKELIFERELGRGAFGIVSQGNHPSISIVMAGWLASSCFCFPSSPSVLVD